MVAFLCLRWEKTLTQAAQRNRARSILDALIAAFVPLGPARWQLGGEADNSTMYPPAWRPGVAMVKVYDRRVLVDDLLIGLASPIARVFRTAGKGVRNMRC